MGRNNADHYLACDFVFYKWCHIVRTLWKFASFVERRVLRFICADVCGPRSLTLLFNLSRFICPFLYYLIFKLIPIFLLKISSFCSLLFLWTFLYFTVSLRNEPESTGVGVGEGGWIEGKSWEASILLDFAESAPKWRHQFTIPSTLPMSSWALSSYWIWIVLLIFANLGIKWYRLF